MRYCLLSLALGGLGFAAPALAPRQRPPEEDAALSILAKNQYNLETGGREFLLNEAKHNDFFLLGELHGENEIPALIRALWPEMWNQGYRHIAAELSPWAAYQLELASAGKGEKVLGLWTKQETRDVGALARPDGSVLWGCDMEEGQPQRPIAELAELNPGDANLQRMAELTKDGYHRNQAPELLELFGKSMGKADTTPNGVSLHENLRATLEIETNRLAPETKLAAQIQREELMKKEFLKHFSDMPASAAHAKVFLRFGRNHLHRGYDARGVSTLGNFIAEFAVARDKKAFKVGAFAAGGKAALRGKVWDADERPDEPAFALLAENARYSATLFDVRPLRALLHGIAREKRTALQANLIYWADSYDALICYKAVTPRKEATD